MYFRLVDSTGKLALKRKEKTISNAVVIVIAALSWEGLMSDGPTFVFFFGLVLLSAGWRVLGVFPLDTGFFKKNSHGTWQASNLRSPLQSPLQSCNWKGLNVPNLNGCFFWRPTATTRKKQLWSWGARGIPRLNLLFYRMAVFYEEPGLKRRALSVSASTTFSHAQVRTLDDIRTKDAKYHGSNLNFKSEKSSHGTCVAGAALWDACCSFVWQALGFGSMMALLRGPAMQLTCNTHATHSQHNTQHEHFSCKFSIRSQHTRNTQSTQHATRALFL